VSAQNPNASRYFSKVKDDIIRRNHGATYAQLQSMIDSATISPDSWMAVTGQTLSQYDSAPLPAPGPDPATQAVGFSQFQQQQQQGGGQPAPGNWMEVLAGYS